MRLLVDEGVDVRVIKVLTRLGHDARRVPSGATNGAVIRLAQQEHRVLLTRDSDFANSLLYPPSRHAGVIHLAIHPPWLEKIAPALTRLLESATEHALLGKIIVLEETGYHQVS